MKREAIKVKGRTAGWVQPHSNGLGGGFWQGCGLYPLTFRNFHTRDNAVNWVETQLTPPRYDGSPGNQTKGA